MLRHYFSMAARSLYRERVNSGLAIFGLALCLACFVGAHLFATYIAAADSGFPQAQRIYTIFQGIRVRAMGIDFRPSAGSPPALAAPLRADFPRLAAVAHTRTVDQAVVTVGGKPSFRKVVFVEPEFLEIFAFPFEAGSARAALEGARAALLTPAAAAALFGRTRSVVGSTIHFAGIGDVPVAGVVAVPSPSRFGRSVKGGDDVNVFVVTHEPEDIEAPLPGFERLDARTAHKLQWLGFGVAGGTDTYILFPSDGSFTPAMLNRAFPAFIARHVSLDPGDAVRFEARPIADVYAENLDELVFFGSFAPSVTLVLRVLGGLVLVTACLNFVNLATARSLTRAKEIGLRKVLGAHRRQIVAQHLFEGVVAAALAMPIALLALQAAIGALDSGAGLQVATPWRAGAGFWAFAVGLTAAVGAASAAFPAAVLAGAAPIAALRAGVRRAGPKGLRAGLIGLQFAVASLLLIAVFVVSRQNGELERSAAASTRAPLLVIDERLEDAGIDPDAFRRRLAASPYIEAVTGASIPPWNRSASGAGYAREPDDPTAVRLTQNLSVSYGYFRALGIRLLAGRTFSAEHGDEHTTGSSGRVVLDRLAALQFGWSDPEQAVGKTIYYASSSMTGGTPTPLEIIGVVEHAEPRLMGFPTRAFVYGLDAKVISFPIVEISAAHVQAALAEIDRLWAELAPGYPLQRQFVDERFAAVYRIFRALTRGFTAIAAFAFAISVTGLVGMTVFIAGRRRHEMGVRKVLGAKSRGLFGLLLRDYLAPVLVANLAVWPLALLAARSYTNFFLRPAPLTPVPFLASLGITVLVATAVVARYALLAARVEPARVLRYE